MIIKCKMCGGDLHPVENATTCECEFCGTVQTLPKLDNERRANLYDRANHFRRNNDYDKAMSIFEQILQDDRTDAEAYWSLVLCRYGIEYVEDPATHKRVPTVNRVQFTSILADEDYKSALAYADAVQRGLYEEEARNIDGIQKGILEISKQEKPFDVFICYKETDAQGKRTPDSVLANDLYHQLTREGLNVFFSRITLEDKLGQQYEPYIFAALNSANVMVVLGTKPEYFNAVWVKNEWSRYLALIKAGANKTLIPAYKDMDPYELPDEFSHLQAQDMSKLGFMQDLIRGIKKLKGDDRPSVQPIVMRTAGLDGSNVAALLDRAFLALEDGEWSKADDFCEKALNIDAHNVRAYIGKLMAERKIRQEGDISAQQESLEKSGNYQKALRFADEATKARLAAANQNIKHNIEQKRLAQHYDEAMTSLQNASTVAQVQNVKRLLITMGTFESAANGIKLCDEKIEAINSTAYGKANELMKQQQYAQAAMAFRTLGDYRDSQSVAAKCDTLEKQKQAQLAAEQAEQRRIEAELRAKEEAEQAEKERVAAELKAREDEIHRRKVEALKVKVRIISIIAVITAAACVVAQLLTTRIIIPKNNYNSAMKLLDTGKYDEAIDAFAALDGYSDSSLRIQQAQADMAFAAQDYNTVNALYATLPEMYQDNAEDLAAMYNDAQALLDAGNFDEAAANFAVLGSYKDASEMIPECIYRNAENLATSGQLEEAAKLYQQLNGYKDSYVLKNQIEADELYNAGDFAGAYDIYATLDEAYQSHAADYETMYAAAQEQLVKGQYDEAAAGFAELGKYRDAEEKVVQCAWDEADALFDMGQYAEAAQAYDALGDHEKMLLSTYKQAEKQAEAGKYRSAAELYMSIADYADSRERHYQAGVLARENDELADACAIFGEDVEYGDSVEALYQTGIIASKAQNYAVSVPAFTAAGEYKDAAMKCSMDTYAWGSQLYDDGDYDKSAEVFASMGDFSDAPTRANEARYAAAGVAMSNGAYDDAATRYTALGNFRDSADKANVAAYAAADEQLEAGDYIAAKARFANLDSYSDSKAKTQECDYRPAKALYENGKYQAALDLFTTGKLSGYKDSDTIMNDCRYQLGKEAMVKGDYTTARDSFDAAGDYSDSEVQATECRRLIALATAQKLESNGEYEAAYEQYGLCKEIGKQQEMAYQAALVKLSGSNYADAVSWYEKAGDYSDAREQILSIGEYYYTTQQYNLAENVYVKALGTGVAAQRLYELGQYYEALGNNKFAARCYREAGDYEDAADKVMLCEYQMAEEMFSNENWKGAKALYAKLPGYKDADSKIIECDKKITAAALAALDAKFMVGNFVTFGTYPQTADGNDQTPIEWLVIARNGNKVLLISRYGLDYKPYNTSYAEVTWETCTLRTWLNTTFLKKAFSTAEQTAILTTTVDNSETQCYKGWRTKGGNNTQDKVFLLSYTEANKYFDVESYENGGAGENMKSRITTTAYAAVKVEQFISFNEDITSDGEPSEVWWLRSPGNYQSTAAYVHTDGSLYPNFVDVAYNSIRPALWINLKSLGLNS